MNNSITLLFGVHLHQPVGNFESVFEEAYTQSYQPFLEAMNRHPGIRFTFHATGPLLEYLEDHHPDYLDLLGQMVARGQVEIMGGGFYEPILVAIPRADRLGQLAMMTEYCERRFNTTPKGAWLAERVWEPALASDLAEAGIKYIAVDDFHLKVAGITGSALFGTYITEDQGMPLAVFPISEELRYMIPFQPVHKVIEYLHANATADGSRAAIIADDGGKFGLWPGTHQWVFVEGWLENFLTALEENADTIRTATFSEYLDTQIPWGRVYIPCASYFEMSEWSLAPEQAQQFEDFIELHKQDESLERFRPFIRGGFWRNFMARYSESNWMNKRVIHLSRRLAETRLAKPRSAKIAEAERALYRAQCNCAYWHGVFGGLYLPHLRHAVYQNIITAENILDQLTQVGKTLLVREEVDYDADGQLEVHLANRSMAAFIHAGHGGALKEVDFKPRQFNLLNGLTRRIEAYHQKILVPPELVESPTDRTPSIHEAQHESTEGLAELLHNDWYRRLSALDHFLPRNTTLEAFSRCEFQELGDFVLEPYRIVRDNLTRANEVKVQREGALYFPWGKLPFRVIKKFGLDRFHSRLTIDWTITNLGERKVDCLVGHEFNLGMLSGSVPDRRYHIPGRTLENAMLGSEGREEAIPSVEVILEWERFKQTFVPSEPVDLWRFPIVTVSQSEHGYEKVYQASCLLFLRPLLLQPGESSKFHLDWAVEAW